MLADLTLFMLQHLFVAIYSATRSIHLYLIYLSIMLSHTLLSFIGASHKSLLHRSTVFACTLYNSSLPFPGYWTSNSSRMPASLPKSSSGEPGTHPTSATESKTKNKKVEEVPTQIEKPGRQKPDVFKTAWHEFVFAFHS
jgi:hypothetical protein